MTLLDRRFPGIVESSFSPGPDVKGGSAFGGLRLEAIDPTTRCVAHRPPPSCQIYMSMHGANASLASNI